MGFPAVHEDSDVFGVLVDLPHQQLQEVREVSLILLLGEQLPLAHQTLLTHLHQKVHQLLFFLQRLQQKLEKAERTP